MIRNIEAAKRLVERYRAITLEEINKVALESGFPVYEELTGFGSKDTCSLCADVYMIPIRIPDCTECVWSLNGHPSAPCVGFYGDPTHNTYFAIERATTPEGLLQAFRNRADLLNKYIDEAIKK